MMRRGFWFPGFLLCGLLACGSGDTGGGDGSAIVGDAGVTGDGGSAVNDGGGSPGLNLCKGAGCIGATCAQDSDCKEGTGGAAVCWLATLRNNQKYLATPGGYCSRSCSKDTDCGTGVCTTIPGESQGYCFARCADANTCRKPGYACLLYGVNGYCYPDTNLTCDPTAGGCNATLPDGTIVGGGCIRSAYENEGLCHVACQVGQKTCPADTSLGTSNPIAQHCVFLDMSRTSSGAPSPMGDKWTGPVCLDLQATPTAANQPCTYWDECGDGYQCNRFDAVPANRVCLPLCAQVNGMQSANLYLAPGGKAASNTCTAPSATCTDALRAGVQNGNAGLCVNH